MKEGFVSIKKMEINIFGDENFHIKFQVFNNGEEMWP